MAEPSPAPAPLTRVVLGVTGGIAAFKAAELARLFVKDGIAVDVAMTEAATRFVTPMTFQALTGRPVATDLWTSGAANAMDHIAMSRGADLIVVAPASADFLAKLAHGNADDLLSTMCLARECPLLVAPAMNVQMWLKAATQRNVAQLRTDGVVILGPDAGDQACGEVGDGRMIEAQAIFDAVVASRTPKVLDGKRVLVTAGPTFEAIDPVRGITNLSSGKMGFAIARAAREAGAEVTLVAGPVSLATPRGVTRVDVKSAREMLAATMAEEPKADVFIATAAVADWRPVTQSEEKIKKEGDGKAPVVSFTENPDILLTVAQGQRARSGALYCVGFAAETHDLVTHARAKLARKGIPLLVGNIGPLTFGLDDNQLLLVDAHSVQELPRASKLELARQLVAEIARRLPGCATP